MDKKVNNLCQVASISRYVICDGQSKGLEVIDCNNGKLRFLLNVSKALDIMQLYHEGKNLSFVSKNGFTLREIPYMRRFEGGMLYTVGLDSVGDRKGYEIHGNFHNNLATVLSAVCDENGIKIVAEIKDTALFGQNLVVKRTLFTEINGDTVHLVDELTNYGYREENYSLLYHVNVGYPMLDSGATISADVNSITPRTKYAEKQKNRAFFIEEPTDNAEETCYYVSMKEPTVSLENKKINKVFTLRYSKDTLPKFVEWKSMASGDYALGLEPTTTYFDDNFEYNQIKSGETVKFTLDFTVKSL